MSRFLNPSAADIAARLSRSSRVSASEPQEEYDVIQTPPSAGPLLKEESLKPTPSVTPWDRRWLGLVVHNVAVGVVSTALPLAVYPFMTCNLNMEGTQTLSVRMLLALPWVLKPAFLLAMDSLPMFGGFRRRPYVLMGWIIAAVALVWICFISQPAPFFGDRSLVGVPLQDLSVNQLTTINHSAPDSGALYVCLMCVATVGYVLADVAADGLTGEVAQRHICPESTPHEDKALLSTLTLYRTAAMLFTFPFMGVGMSGWDYGGDFDFTLEFTQVMTILGVVAATPLPFVWWTIAETPTDRQSFSKNVREVWGMFENQATNYVLACRFVGGIFGGVSSIAVNPVAVYFAGVQPLNDNVVSFVAMSAVLFIIAYISKKNWELDYRVVMIVSTAVVLFLDCGATMFTLWNVVRSQWFWIGLPVMESIPSVLDYVILSQLLAELVDPGSEIMMSAVVTAVSFTANALGLTIAKQVDAQFEVSNQDIMTDSTKTRFHLTVIFVLAYVAQVVSIVCVVTLPRHASEAREWKKRSSRSTARAIALITLLTLSLLFAVTVHVLSVVETTTCLGVAAGTGCS